MTDEQLSIAAFVFLDELKAWKQVHDRVAIRSETFEQVICRDEFDVQDFVKRRAAGALIRFYHEEQAKAA